MKNFKYNSKYSKTSSKRGFPNRIIFEIIVLAIAVAVTTKVICSKKASHQTPIVYDNKKIYNKKKLKSIKNLDDSEYILDTESEKEIPKIYAGDKTLRQEYSKNFMPLARYVTKIDTKELKEPNRLHNVKKAAQYINGVTIMPNREFSFHEYAWQRNDRYKAYLNAASMTPSGMDAGKGGGMCQVSSTLYNAVLFMPNLKVTERFPHSREVGYVPRGRDAAYDTSGKDLKFLNLTGYPITIKAQATDDFVKVEILGRKTNDFKVKIFPATISDESYNSISVDVKVQVFTPNKKEREYHIKSRYNKLRNKLS